MRKELRAAAVSWLPCATCGLDRGWLCNEGRLCKGLFVRVRNVHKGSNSSMFVQ